MRKFLFVILTVLVTVISISPFTYALAGQQPDIQIEIDGQVIEQTESTGFAKIVSDRTMVPFRLVTEALRYNADWEASTKKITLSNNAKVVTHVVGDTFTVDHANLKTDIGVPSYIDESSQRTMVSVRLIAEAFGCVVSFEQKTFNGIQNNVVVITTPYVSAEEPTDVTASYISAEEPTDVATSYIPTEEPADVTAPYVPTEESVYESMIALKEQYPDGMSWTNDNYYAWNGGVYSVGYGCLGFAFILSDTAFGTLPARQHTDFSNIRVGDIVRINDDTHSVIVLSTDGANITVAEGNYDSSILWGREFSLEQLKANGDYILTRYPE